MSWKCALSLNSELFSLGLDVCTGCCAVAVVQGERVLASHSEPMLRGHVERLAPLAEQALAEAGVSPQSLNVVAVTTGPGSFTGARLGVAFARGMALATGAKAVGVTVFEAMAKSLQQETVVIALDGRRDDLFVQRFDAGTPTSAPYATTAEDAWRIAVGASQFALLGSGADLLLASAPDVVRKAAEVVSDAFPPETVARIGACRVQSGEDVRPAPLYMRAPDAKPTLSVA